VLDGRYTFVEEGVVDPSGDGPMIAAQPEGVETKRDDEVASAGSGNGKRNGERPANPTGDAEKDIRATA
jgi:hypothetical protein